jgi:membrane-bound lytic murein transglycosylase D
MTWRNFWSLGLLSAVAAGATAVEPPKAAPTAPQEISSDELYQAGKDLFETFAPPEIKAQYEFPDKAQWDDFAARLQRALESNDLTGLAQYEPEARAALSALRALPGNEEYTAWLEERLDYIEAAKQTVQHPPPPATTPKTERPEGPAQYIPLYDLWLHRLKNRPKPSGADQLIPGLGAVFATAGLPPELVWLAEVESTLNPTARSPTGARGLFQLMPATARELGLSTFLPDERTDPNKSAGAAAQLLRILYRKFDDWPLAIAAYNAGAGRVQRTLDLQKAKTFAEIAAVLPVETRMYVPKVLAMLQIRAGVPPTRLAPPRN